MAKAAKATRTTKSTTTTAPSEPRVRDSGRFWRYVLVLALLGVSGLGWLSMLTFQPTDPPSPLIYSEPPVIANRAGIVGAYVAFTLRYWLGVGSYLLLTGATVGGVLLLMGRKLTELPWRLTGLAVLTASVSAIAWRMNPDTQIEIIQHPAGVLGMATAQFLMDSFGSMGSWFVIALMSVGGLMLTADNLVKALFRQMAGARQREKMARTFAELRKKVSSGETAGQPALAGAAARHQPPVNMTAVATPPAAKPAAPQPELKPVVPPPSIVPPKAETPSEPKPKRSFFGRKEKTQAGSASVSKPDKPAKTSAPAKPAPSAPLLEAARPAASKAKPVKVKRARQTELPSLDLLGDPVGGYREKAEIQAAQRKLVLQQTLEDFNVDANVVGFMTGPVITLFEVSLSPGVKVAAITNLATDIARSLAVPGVRVVPPRFGMDTVGIEVPNLDKEIVRIKQLMMLRTDAATKMTLPMYLGKDAGGNAIVLDLAKAPHMLIAGTTGSGKSVCINTIIMSLLLTKTVDDVRFILVDPKMVEMAAFERLPHLLCPTINDMKKAEDILEWATIKMDERYELLKEAGVKNLAGFNALSPEEIYEAFGAESDEEKAKIPTKLPCYVIIIDELADLMMTSSKEVESHIIRIAQKARAVGIHLVLATQRPSANVVTGLIKSNMPCRVSFRVASGQESRIVLDQKGAEVLLGQGDMLVLQPGDSNLVRAQGTYIDDGEIRSVCRDIQKDTPQEFDAELLRLQSRSAGDISGEKDDLFDQAVEIVLAAQRGSVSLLQRRLQIGYGRASRIIDQMGEAGILGEHKGSQARECLMTIDDWQQFQSSVAADQSGANSLSGAGTVA